MFKIATIIGSTLFGTVLFAKVKRKELFLRRENGNGGQKENE